MNASTKTVRRGTKRYRSILETAHDVQAYTLENYFIGAECNPLALVRYMGGDANLTGKLTFNEGKERPYTLHVHSNCWFEFNA